MPDAVDERGPRILAAVLLETIRRHHRGLVLHSEVDAVVAARDAQVRHLGEEVADVVRRGRETAGEIAIANRTRIAEVEPGRVPRDEHLHDARRLLLGVQEGDSDDVVRAVAGTERLDLGLGARQVEREGVGRRDHAEARSLTDTDEQHHLVVDPRRRGVEHRDDLETGE